VFYLQRRLDCALAMCDKVRAAAPPRRPGRCVGAALLRSLLRRLLMSMLPVFALSAHMHLLCMTNPRALSLQVVDIWFKHIAQLLDPGKVPAGADAPEDLAESQLMDGLQTLTKIVALREEVRAPWKLLLEDPPPAPQRMHSLLFAVFLPPGSARRVSIRSEKPHTPLPLVQIGRTSLPRPPPSGTNWTHIPPPPPAQWYKLDANLSPAPDTPRVALGSS